MTTPHGAVTKGIKQAALAIAEPALLSDNEAGYAATAATQALQEGAVERLAETQRQFDSDPQIPHWGNHLVEAILGPKAES